MILDLFSEGTDFSLPTKNIFNFFSIFFIVEYSDKKSPHRGNNRGNIIRMHYVEKTPDVETSGGTLQ
jgi:hypothetical protein